MSILSTAFVSQWESENLIREQLENVYLEPIHIHLQTDADREWVKKLKSNEPNAGFQFNLGVALQQKYLFALALNPSYHCYPSILGQIRTYARIVLIPFYEFLKCFKSKQKSLLWMLSCDEVFVCCCCCFLFCYPYCGSCFFHPCCQIWKEVTCLSSQFN